MDQHSDRPVAVDHAGKRLSFGLLVSLVFHGLLLLIHFGTAGLGTKPVPAPIVVRLADPVPPLPPEPLPDPVAVAAPPAPVPLAPPVPQGMKVYAPPVKTKKPRKISSPVRRVQDVGIARVLTQDVNKETFAVPLPAPEESPTKTLDPKEAQHGSDDGQDVSAPDLAKAAEEEAKRRQQEEEKRAEEKRLADVERQKKVEEELVRKKLDEQLARQKAAELESQQKAAEQAAQLAQQRAAEQAAQQKAAEQLAQQRAAEQAAQRAAEQLAQQRAAEQAAQRAAEQLAQQRAAEQAAQRAAEQLAQQRAAEQAAQRAAEQLAQQRAAEQAAQRAAEQLAQQRAAEQAAQRAAEQLAQQRAAEQAAHQRAAEQAAQQRAAEQLAQQRANEAARQALSNLPPDPFGQGSGNRGAGTGGTGGTGTGIPAPGPSIANRAREMARGMDLLKGNPPRSFEESLRNRRRMINTGAERDVPVKLYIDSFRTKIERNGGLNYSQMSTRDLRADLLVAVTIRADGSVEDVAILRSSGNGELDENVRRIVRLNAKYSAFPPNIAERYDLIEIRRVWSFGETLRLLEDLR